MPRGDPVERAKWRKLVRREHLLRIASAWVITVPAAAALAAGVFFIANAVAR